MIIDNKEHIVQAVKNAGVVGAGGAGFPTHVKLQAKVDTVIVNASECEPLLCSDHSMMIQFPEKLIAGLRIAMKAVGAKKGIIGIKEHYKHAVNALRKVLPKDDSIKLHLLENYYPAGDEFLLVYEVTGKIIPEGGIPLHVGAMVANAITLMQVADAIQGQPVVERTVTLAGEFQEPKVVIVPIGTTYETLIEMAGGVTQKDVVLVDGGPMMGKIISDWKQGIGKTTSGVLAFPKDHFIIRMSQKPLGQMIKQSKSACCQCFRCSDLCPRSLLGHELFPHMTMRTIDYNQSEPIQHITSAFLCSQCGMCELVACDIMQLSPRQIYAAYKKKLIEKGVKNPNTQKPKTSRSTFEYTKVSIPTVMKKINVERYDVPMSFVGKKTVKKVRIPLNRHIGEPAIPKVSVNQTVLLNQEIAASPEDVLGSVYHASISGRVSEVDTYYIEIIN